VPQAVAGAPNDGLQHEIGEMVVDANGSLFLCVAKGTPGTWRQVALV
jgi:predicted NBD/HSP70 family sugar kinase